METQKQPRPTLPLLALLALASALGVAVAIALAGVAMLLAAPAYAEEGRHNPFEEPLAGVYVYRLPPHAVLERLTFTLGGAEPRPALLTLRRTAVLVERTAEIGPGGTRRVELEYRSRTRCCWLSSAARASGP